MLLFMERDLGLVRSQTIVALLHGSAIKKFRSSLLQVGVERG